MPLISEQGAVIGEILKGLSGLNRLTTYGTSGGFQLPTANIVHLSANLDSNSSTGSQTAIVLTLPEAKPYLLVGQLNVGSVASVNNVVTTSLRYGNAGTDVGTVIATKSWTHWVSTQLARFRPHLYGALYRPSRPSE